MQLKLAPRQKPRFPSRAVLATPVTVNALLTHDIPSQERVNEMFRQYWKAKSQSAKNNARDQIALMHQKFIKLHAEMALRKGRAILGDKLAGFDGDLLGVGNEIMLRESIPKYQEDRGAKFTTFLARGIDQAFANELEAYAHKGLHSANETQGARQYMEATAALKSFEDEYGRRPKDLGEFNRYFNDRRARRGKDPVKSVRSGIPSGNTIRSVENLQTSTFFSLGEPRTGKNGSIRTNEPIAAKDSRRAIAEFASAMDRLHLKEYGEIVWSSLFLKNPKGSKTNPANRIYLTPQERQAVELFFRPRVIEIGQQKLSAKKIAPRIVNPRTGVSGISHESVRICLNDAAVKICSEHPELADFMRQSLLSGSTKGTPKSLAAGQKTELRRALTSNSLGITEEETAIMNERYLAHPHTLSPFETAFETRKSVLRTKSCLSKAMKRIEEKNKKLAEILATQDRKMRNS